MVFQVPGKGLVENLCDLGADLGDETSRSVGTDAGLVVHELALGVVAVEHLEEQYDIAVLSRPQPAASESSRRQV